MQNKMDPL